MQASLHSPRRQSSLSGVRKQHSRGLLLGCVVIVAALLLPLGFQRFQRLQRAAFGRLPNSVVVVAFPDGLAF